jgi:hypothetical protein
VGKKSAPPPPDYAAAATAQGEANREAGLEQWRLQNSPVTTPYGTRTLVADPNSPSGYRIEETLNAEDQARLDQQRQIMSGLLGLAPGALGYLGDVIGKPMNPGSLPPMVSGVNTEGLQYGVGRGNMIYDVDMSGAPQVSSGEGTRNRVEQAMLDRYTKFITPEQEREQKALENRIANMGGVTTSTAGRRMVGDLRQSQADEREKAAYEAIMRGGEEATREFGMDMGRRQQAIQEMLARAGFVNRSQGQDFEQQLAQGQFRNTAVGQNIANMFQNAGLANSSRSQGMQELLNLRQAPLNELMALLGGTQVAPMQFQGGGGASWQPPNTYQATQDQYNAQVNAANARRAQGAQTMGGLFSLGSMFFSDRRLKTNIQRIGATAKGLPVYSYDFFGQPEIGVMADEAERMFPEAVALHPSGFKMVDYALIG